DPVLHPGDHPAFEPDVEQRVDHQDHEDQHGLDDDDPHGVGAEDVAHHAPRSISAPRSRDTTEPLPARRMRFSPRPCELAATQTTSSGMPTASVGSATAPWSVRTTTSSPAVTPIDCRVRLLSRATERRAVAL